MLDSCLNLTSLSCPNVRSLPEAHFLVLGQCQAPARQYCTPIRLSTPDATLSPISGLRSEGRHSIMYKTVLRCSSLQYWGPGSRDRIGVS